MRSHILATAITAALLAVVAPLAAQAADYTPKSDTALVAKGGWWDADVDGASGAPALGVELSTNDTWTEMPAGILRHMLSWNHADHDGLELNTAEWNMHWMFQTNSGVWMGLGPGLGYVWADGKNLDDGVAAQFGASAHYIQGNAFFGVESRYQWTEADSADNWLTMAKVGWAF